MRDAEPKPIAIEKNGSVPKNALIRGTTVPQGQSTSEDAINFWEMVQRRWWIIAGVGLISMTYFVSTALQQQSEYVGQFRLLVEPVNNVNAQLADGSNNNNNPSSELDYDTQIQVLQSPGLLDRSIEKLRPLYPNLTYNNLVQGLSISQLRGTKIIQVQYQSMNPAEVPAVLEQLSKDYLSYSLNERQTNLRQGLQFVQNQLNSAQERVDELQLRLQAFRQNNQFFDPDGKAGQVIAQSEQLAQQQLELDQQLQQAEAELARLQEETGAIATLNSSPGYQQLVGQLRELETQIALERTRFQDDSLTIRVLREKQANVLGLLGSEARQAIGGKAAEISNRIQILQVQQQAIAETQNTLDQEFQQIPGLSRQYTDLQRELQIATESLNRFLATRENLQVEAAQKEIPWQLVEPPPQLAASRGPDTTRSLLIGVAASLALGVATAFLVEKMDKTFHTADALSRKFKLPVLAVIPLQSDLLGVEYSVRSRRRKNFLRKIKTQLRAIRKSLSSSLPFMPQPDDYDVFEFEESFKLLQTNLQMMQSSSGQSMQTIVITSAQAGDGKSTIAWYLAQTAASMGQRVLLVDTDLRRSQLQTRLQLSETRGLGELFSSNLVLKDVIQQPLPDSSLYILPSGETTLDPIQVFSSPRMHALANKLKDTFDLVIYDAPPVNGLADALQLSVHADSLLLVVRLHKTDKVAAAKAIESLSHARARLLGLVANGR
ncbi:polysaccharide biosynthesis tyrosine autokinase [Leptolyngbya sp. FACHB-711]|uniref:GumC family protein n=1 Tax=Leptolyngbya sp. FACHB-711 TaxID=2692813 RepID=UPI001687C07C|nr:polysaccharide biosynthesis tyrosine autokinase [Leptolyngbya sp. FACHB-711]MBD2028056.1 polysaccharide biosynthesis tyrosine autokinase [Leptolyngbya sp. FACHB-711]